MPLLSEETSTTRHDVLSDAFDKLAAEPAPAGTTITTTDAPAQGEASTTSAPQDGAPPPASERPRDERGRFAAREETTDIKPEATDKPKAEATATDKPAAGATAAAGTPKAGSYGPLDALPTGPLDPPVLKPPISWKPAEREAWNKTPREVQEAALRREKEIAAKLNEVEETAKSWDAFERTVQPYEQMLRDSGVQHPLQAVSNLLQTARVLRYGTPGEKAQTAARIVRDFGVGIEELDSALAGEAQIRSQGPQYDPEIFAAQVEQRLQQRLAAQAQQMAAQRQAAEFAAFAAKPEHEFASDVRNDIAAFQEAARRRGVVMSLDDAYARAVALDPDISRVLEQRKAAEAAKAQIASMQKTKAAASSIKTQPTAAPAAQPTDRRDLLSQAYDRLAGR